MTDSVDQLLDETLDDLADLPTSNPFLPGAHQCTMFITRDKKKSSSYIVKFKHIAVLELANASPDKLPPKPGDEALMFIHTKKKDGAVNEFGQGQLKMILAPLAERLNTKSISGIIEQIKDGIEVGIVSGVKQQDNYPDQMVLNKIQLV